MAQLLSQCHEVLNGIFQGVDPEDLASLSKTCRLFNGFIKNDRLLWKDMYLRNYVRRPKRYRSHQLTPAGPLVLGTGAA